jgi:hypothetical protein
MSASWQVPDYRLRGYVCEGDCVGYCTCEPCISCGEMGHWTTFIEDANGQPIGSECDQCQRDDNGEDDPYDDVSEPTMYGRLKYGDAQPDFLP